MLQPTQQCLESYFSLPASEGVPLAAGVGDRVQLGLRLGRNGRDRRVQLEISDPEEAAFLAEAEHEERCHSHSAMISTG